MRPALFAVACAAVLLPASPAAPIDRSQGPELVVGERTYFRGAVCRFLAPAEFVVLEMAREGEPAGARLFGMQPWCFIGVVQMTVVRLVRSARARDTGRAWNVVEVRLGREPAFIVTMIPVVLGEGA